MKKTFGNLLIIFAFFAFTCSAQTSEAKKIDEFNQSYYADAIARMDFVAMTLAEQPNTKAYIIVYSGSKDNPGSSFRYANRLKNYLLTRRVDEKRVVAIGAGQKEEQITEVWIVAEGAMLPSQTVFFSSEQISASQLTKFDQYTIKLPQEGEWDVWDGSYEDEPTRLTRLAEVLRQRKDLRLYIVARAQGVYVYKPVSKKLPDGRRKYIQVRSSKLSDPTGFDQKMANIDKAYLIKKFGIEPSRITAVGNGYSLFAKSEVEILSPNEAKLTSSVAARNIELWLVPKNELKPVLKTILKR